VPVRGPRAPRAERLTRFAPSGRSFAIGLAILAVAAGAYALARQSSMFAIQRVEVRGADPATAEAVRRALEPLTGRSLLALGGGEVARRAQALPSVVSAAYDRAFPHTLRVTVVEERPVAVLHRGNDLFLVSARARVVRALPQNALPGLPRIWVPRAVDVNIGATLGGDPGAAVSALVPLRRIQFALGVATAEATAGQLSLRLRTGLEIRLGDAHDLPLKLTIARQVAPTIPPGAGTFLDVSVPDRPVAGAINSQLSGRGR
jgi:cell division protein FtsQ